MEKDLTWSEYINEQIKNLTESQKSLFKDAISSFEKDGWKRVHGIDNYYLVVKKDNKVIKIMLDMNKDLVFIDNIRIRYVVPPERDE
jgi:hypothetical protein